MDLPINFTSAAYLIADPTRALMLMHLVDGRAYPAGELAYAAGITAQTASSHLSKLLAGGLLSVQAQGRHRYYRLAGAHIASILEQLAGLTPEHPLQRKPLSPKARQLSFARCCYDHLAGSLGVALTDALLACGYLTASTDRIFEVSGTGQIWFQNLGLDLSTLGHHRTGVARQCLDWTERRPHLAGPLGVRLLALLYAKGWLRRHKNSRAVQITAQGHAGLKEHLGLDFEAGLSHH
ncbi:MAG: HTH-type transcriptional regulator CmtR [Pseudomonas citronellolis]|nr:MAG: HTH-type transcriptional regulator CmtR [Pseudomonas citronellolis]